MISMWILFQLFRPVRHLKRLVLNNFWPSDQVTFLFHTIRFMLHLLHGAEYPEVAYLSLSHAYVSCSHGSLAPFCFSAGELIVSLLFPNNWSCLVRVTDFKLPRPLSIEDEIVPQRMHKANAIGFVHLTHYLPYNVTNEVVVVAASARTPSMAIHWVARRSQHTCVRARGASRMTA
jgi:hypothetical protein